jgi:glutamate synthase (NADPH/NADH) large chain
VSDQKNIGNHVTPQEPVRTYDSEEHIDLHPIDIEERGACALICSVRKGGEATHGNVKRTIEGLARMGHRTGYIDGEGDGVGIMTDIPRQLWTKRLAHKGLRASLATNRDFWIAHVFISAADRTRSATIIDQICQQITEAGLHVIYDGAGLTNSNVLGPNAKKNEPVFWQIAGLRGQVAQEDLNKTIFNVQTQIERNLGVHFPSFSAHSVIYKVQGTVEILRRYYPELRDPDYASTVTLGHARYSTNTNPIFERAQPFNVLGHNGEFNTIGRFRMEAAMAGIHLLPSNSDSQDVDRVIRALCMTYGFDLIEAMEYVFPPYEHDLIQTSPEIHQLYHQMRQSFGPFAQGPAGIAARLGDTCVFSVDALGLRPLWFGETEKEYFASSERGVYPLDSMVSDPKPMAPGEKIALKIVPGRSIEVLDHPAIQRHVYARHLERANTLHSPETIWESHISNLNMLDEQPVLGSGGGSNEVSDENAEQIIQALPWQDQVHPIDTTTMAAMGWERYHVSVMETIGTDNKEQVGSLGWDGPLAALSNTRVNITDYFKEVISCVTNPAIDREREQAQFSTSVLLGARPTIAGGFVEDDLLVEIKTPLILGGHGELGDFSQQRALAESLGTVTLEDLILKFNGRYAIISTSTGLDESVEGAIERIQEEAVDCVEHGIRLLILDDNDVFKGDRLWLDPMLVTMAVDKILRSTKRSGQNLRRQVGIVLRSGAMRDLHDLILCASAGANAILPYALYATAIGLAPRRPSEVPSQEEINQRLNNTISTLTKGLEKVTSTIGCHELRGYGHSFSSIGLSKPLATFFGTPNYYGGDGRGLTWIDIKEDAEERAAELRGEKKNRLTNVDRFFPKFWKKIEDVAHGQMALEEFTKNLFVLEEKQPIAVRHVLGIKESSVVVDPDEVDLTIGDHSLPVVIGAMSFGSQGELSYKAYAEAAEKLNIICVNGEGGELPDMMGKYPHNRGQQIASGRFGVNITFLNSCYMLEIKVGQGAKPGEGGHLPGYKVTDQVATARKTIPGVGLISPSNNHDLYSIEDLVQLIDELKTANTRAKISVKIPIVPGVGIIAVGVAKAGAHIINLTGYDGGTGAARAHALRHVGLPAEVGVWLAHRALVESGLRDNVELWCDGGMKSGRDVVKMLCLGANRVGFGTLAMVAVGCTICRGCHEGTCHVGITTHVKTREEAELKGFKSFRPFEEKGSSQGIVNVFNLLAEDIRLWTAKAGVKRAQDLVGRADLLEQIAMHEQLDLTHLLRRVPPVPKKLPQSGGRRLTRPRNTLSKQITSVVAEQVANGEYEMTYDDEQVMAHDRALGTHLIGAIRRGSFADYDKIETVHLSFSNSAIPGNGLGAFMGEPLDILVEGGAQDGAAKCAEGGTLTVLRGLNHNGERVDGSVGKSFAYGAQGGMFIVQGDADTRACIRFSGADVIFGGEIKSPLRDQDGGIGARANLKGYAFEYMTSGRALVLGDPGPWMCSGMSGGTIYQRIDLKMGLDIDALKRRLASGAIVEIMPLDQDDVQEVSELLGKYIHSLEVNNQADATKHLYALLHDPEAHFVKIAVPLLSRVG